MVSRTPAHTCPYKHKTYGSEPGPHYRCESCPSLIDKEYQILAPPPSPSSYHSRPLYDIPRFSAPSKYSLSPCPPAVPPYFDRFSVPALTTHPAVATSNQFQFDTPRPIQTPCDRHSVYQTVDFSQCNPYEIRPSFVPPYKPVPPQLLFTTPVLDNIGIPFSNSQHWQISVYAPPPPSQYDFAQSHFAPFYAGVKPTDYRQSHPQPPPPPTPVTLATAAAPSISAEPNSHQMKTTNSCDFAKTKTQPFHQSLPQPKKSKTKSQHERKTGALHICAICGKGFPRAAASRTHLYSHIQYRPFHCISCESSFSARNNLKRHQKRCHGI